MFSYDTFSQVVTSLHTGIIIINKFFIIIGLIIITIQKEVEKKSKYKI
jgi:hypothetical protein